VDVSVVTVGGGIGGHGIGAEERVRQSAVGGRMVCRKIHASAEGDRRRRADGKVAILAVINSAAIWQHVDVGTFRSKFAVTLP